ncbi:coiled-coil domain-containing protein 60-like isoform X2 [Glandiceps talaboti]
MAPKNRDPRSYGQGRLLTVPSRDSSHRPGTVCIQKQPLPIPSHQGLHIQARSDTVYNCSNPTREAVFRENYARRRRQMTEQGYNAVSYKPYKIVGEPFYLDEGKLILHSLGQLGNEVEVDERSSSSDEDGDADKDNSGDQQGELDGTQPKKFVLRRKSTKNKKTLSREVADGRRMITSVKLGHGLFTIIRTQDNARRNAEEIEHRKLMEKRRREWQPAHIPSSSEGETDEELGEDVDLSSYMCSAPTQRDYSDHEVKEVAFSRASLLGNGGMEATSDEETVRTGSLSPTKSVLTEISTLSAKKRKKKKKVNPPRPFTPCHSNINVQPETQAEEEASRGSIFRQLCALNWILQAMNLDQQKFVMGPILQCWNINYHELEDNSFNKLPMRTVQRDKQTEQRWSRFLTQKDFMERQKRIGRSFGNTLTLASAVGSIRSTPRKSSLAGLASLIQMQRSPSTMSSNHSSTPIPPDNLLEREDVMSRVDEDTEYERGTQRRDSVSVVGNERMDDTQTRESFSARRQRTGSISSIRSTRDIQALTARQNKTRNASLSQKQLEGTPPRKTERAIRTWVASTSRIRAQSAPLGGRENKTDFPSLKYGNLPIELRHKFSDVAEDKALVLHDTLEAMEKKRLWRSEEKFKHITNEKHISTQLEKIKNAAKDPDEVKGSKKKDSELKGDQRRRKNQDEEVVKWFQDLKINLPAAMHEDRKISAIMDRLENIGNFESRKITPQKFLNVLSGLRSWELCSPDISAAIEFVREKVVNMAVDDFEDWCHHHMPQVLRAQSAPPR